MIQMKNLGKILLTLSLMVNVAFATVSAKVEPRNIYEGESATYILTVSGSKIKKPLISDICGNEITATSSQTSIESINGNYKKSYKLSYQFVPRKNCTISSVEIEIDSKIELSNSVDVIIKPRKQDFQADFILSFSTPKTELYIGEPFELTLLLKQRRGAEAIDSKYLAPQFKGFWMKSEESAKRVDDGEFVVTKVVYMLAAQREGKLHIEPATLKIAQRTGVNNWGTFRPQVKWKTYYSNTLDITSKILPNNAKIVGDLSLNASVQKQEINPNEPVNLTISVTGEGNLEDIESFKPYVDYVNIFDEKIIVNKNILTQKLVFVSDRNFTIPAFELIYFDVNTKALRKLKTQPIEIIVRGGSAKDELVIKREEPTIKTPIVTHSNELTVENNYLYILFAFIIGLIVGVLLMLIRVGKSDKKTKKLDIKNEKLLLVKLLTFKDIDSDVANIVDILENNIYSKEKQVVDKKLLKEIIKKYDIS
jgi:hypothetical protein